MILQSGGQERLISEVTTGAGVTSAEGSTKTDGILMTLWVASITGTLQVDVFTFTESGRESLLFSFPLVSAGTSNLLLRKSGVSLQKFRVRATYTGVSDYEIHVRAVENSGESTVRISSPGSLVTSATSITTTPSILLSSSLSDRNGVTIKNFSTSATLYVAESLGKLPASAWPMGPGEVWSLDIQAGTTLYAVASAGTIDVRLAESGG